MERITYVNLLIWFGASLFLLTQIYYVPFNKAMKIQRTSPLFSGAPFLLEALKTLLSALLRRELSVRGWWCLLEMLGFLESMGFYGENCDLTMENGDFMGFYMDVVVCCVFFWTKMGYHRVIKGIEWDTSSTWECSWGGKNSNYNSGYAPNCYTTPIPSGKLTSN